MSRAVWGLLLGSGLLLLWCWTVKLQWFTFETLLLGGLALTLILSALAQLLYFLLDYLTE